MDRIEIQQLEKSFGKKKVLRDVSCVIEEGHIYGLLGRNGAGKSTLLNIINNRMRAEEGQVLYNGQNIRENDGLLQELFLVNDTILFKREETEKVASYFKHAALFYPDFDENLCHHLVAAFDMDTSLRLSKLSTGYRSIFNIILALCVPARFIFLDEPILGLDANHRDLFYKELVDAFMERPRTFVLSTHLIEEVARLIDSVLILDKGMIQVADTVEAVTEKAWSLTGASQDVDAYAGQLNVIGVEYLGNQTTLYVYDDVSRLPDTIQKQKLELQKLFIMMTNRLEEK
ncbi:ATP-binding cassette domain-containing protein [Vagococcus acidifermentans]|uniref:ABC transporter domain-containing protein n=1 Tax=Vagococcus acidifermentans TaxID=564710 RepID=A0A430B0D4_9ENTE|nr:ABC transporter ATP-binding protein [Vagococcus acidifermentans]RSU13800.1 hypothetical protein CBF27_02560 [Vagococcus acidifermentans]